MYTSLCAIRSWNWNWKLTQDNFLIEHWIQRTHRCSAVRCWPWGIYSSWLASRDLGTTRSSYLAWVGPVVRASNLSQNTIHPMLLERFTKISPLHILPGQDQATTQITYNTNRQRHNLDGINQWITLKEMLYTLNMLKKSISLERGCIHPVVFAMHLDECKMNIEMITYWRVSARNM